MVPQDDWWNMFSWVWDTFNQMMGNLSGATLNTNKWSWIVDDDLSWVRATVKWYAHDYYEDTMAEYVDKAKEWLSWTMQNFKNHYNNWVDNLTHSINDAISGSVTEKMNTLKM